MTDVWIVMIEDRHADVDARPFSSEDAAFTHAREAAAEYARRPEDVDEAMLTTGMRREGWVLLLTYGPESDCVRVIKRELDKSEV